MAQNQRTNTLVMTLVVTMATLYGGAMGQSSGCTNVLISLSPCLNYISGNTTTPSSSCCSQLSSVVTSQPQCLCQVLNGGGSSLGININQTQALALPTACNVQTPPTSQCNAPPSDSPPSGTTPSPSNSPPSGTTPSPGTNPTSPPANSPPPSDATSTRTTTLPILCLLLVAAYAMVF